jgi:ribonucleotide reductase alpha subunit
MNTSEYFEYKYENQNELDIVIKYFNKYSVIKEYAYYHLNNKVLRKLKLLILKKDEFSEILEKIIKNSVEVTTEDMLVRTLTKEMTASINKEIINNILKLDK